jgi:hypothetical protein
MPEGSAARTKGKKWGVGGFGKTRGDTVRIETRGGAVSATEASPTSAAVDTRGMLPRMTHDDDGGVDGDAIRRWSWAWTATKRRKRGRVMGKSRAWRGVVCGGWRGVEEGAEAELRYQRGNRGVSAFRV